VTLRLYSTFLCYKNVCFEIMNWKYEFIDITLILTINDDILVTLNDIILTSTILVNLVITLKVHHVSSRQRTIAKYMLVSLYIRAHQSAQETLMKFLFTSTNLSFFNRFIGLYDNTNNL
jgi:hypothetical protein